MTTIMLDEADRDLERAFDHYEQQRAGLGIELIDEFRRSVDQMLAHPRAWQPLDETYRRCRLHRSRTVWSTVSTRPPIKSSSWP